MHTLRTSSFWKRLALAWFLLTLGVAGASPFVNPKTMELICSSGGAITMVVLDDDGQAQAPVQHTLDCSMCLAPALRSEEHTSELQSQSNLVCRLLLEKKKKKTNLNTHG